jgi:hypothetical protein
MEFPELIVPVSHPGGPKQNVTFNSLLCLFLSLVGILTCDFLLFLLPEMLE